MEPLTEVLEMLRIKAVVYYDQDFYSPWAMRFERGSCARVHVLLAGRCVIESADTVMRLGPNDVALIAGGQEHIVSDGSTKSARDSREVYAEALHGRRKAHQTVPVARLISGHIEFDDYARRLLFATMPATIRTHFGDAHHDNTQGLRDQLSSELHAKLRGWEAVVQRIAEILLVRMVRSHLGPQTHSAGLLAALSDSRLSAAIALMHARYHESLTLAEIARAAGMSRSAFAAQFKRVTQVPAMMYLSNWRLLRAREMLANPDLSVAHVAAACGHRSTEGFSRAFKRAYGMSPARLRLAF